MGGGANTGLDIAGDDRVAGVIGSPDVVWSCPVALGSFYVGIPTGRASCISCMVRMLISRSMRGGHAEEVTVSVDFP